MLWDADGVLQEMPGGWVAHFRPLVGDRVEQFLTEAWEVEKPALRGDGSWPELLPDLLGRWGLEGRVEEVLDLWMRLEGAPESFALLAEVRGSGVRCYLATNQDGRRAAHMHRQFDYGRLMDGCYYSHALGVAKPSPAYFESTLADLAVAADTVLFVDDNADNVLAARELGLHAEHWTIADGIDRLRARLTAHGVLAPE